MDHENQWNDHALSVGASCLDDLLVEQMNFPPTERSIHTPLNGLVLVCVTVAISFHRAHGSSKEDRIPCAAIKGKHDYPNNCGWIRGVKRLPNMLRAPYMSSTHYFTHFKAATNRMVPPWDLTKALFSLTRNLDCLRATRHKELIVCRNCSSEIHSNCGDGCASHWPLGVHFRHFAQPGWNN